MEYAINLTVYLRPDELYTVHILLLWVWVLCVVVLVMVGGVFMEVLVCFSGFGGFGLVK